jgi:hypothetical protein
MITILWSLRKINIYTLCLLIDKYLYIHWTDNKCYRKPKGQSQIDNPEKVSTENTQDEVKQDNNTRQYVLDTTMYKQCV